MSVNGYLVQRVDPLPKLAADWEHEAWRTAQTVPLDYFRQAPDKESYTINGNGHQYVYHTNNANAFWAAP